MVIIYYVVARETRFERGGGGGGGGGGGAPLDPPLHLSCTYSIPINMHILEDHAVQLDANEPHIASKLPNPFMQGLYWLCFTYCTHILTTNPLEKLKYVRSLCISETEVVKLLPRDMGLYFLM